MTHHSFIKQINFVPAPNPNQSVADSHTLHVYEGQFTKVAVSFNRDNGKFYVTSYTAKGQSSFEYVDPVAAFAFAKTIKE